eukprot:Gb_12890 [translate_table: standard]
MKCLAARNSEKKALCSRAGTVLAKEKQRNGRGRDNIHQQQLKQWQTVCSYGEQQGFGRPRGPMEINYDKDWISEGDDQDSEENGWLEEFIDRFVSDEPAEGPATLQIETPPANRGFEQEDDKHPKQPSVQQG